MSETVKEIISPSGKYKATILDKTNCYSLNVYTLSEDFEPETGIGYGQYWSRKNTTPICIDKELNAIYFAIQELGVIIGEPDSPLSIEWIRDFSFCKEAKFINSIDIEVFGEWIDSESNERKLDKIEAKTIIDFTGICLVEEVCCDDEWQMGQINENGSIICWGNYGTLKDAIRGL